MSKMSPVKVVLFYERSTPGTHLYKCSEADRAYAVIQNVYVSKRGLNGAEPPEKILVTIEDAGQTT